MADIIRAPWTPKQVADLNYFQSVGIFHGFTCGNDPCRADLVATEAGWTCPVEGCGYTRDWAHAFMADRAQTKARLDTFRARFSVTPTRPTIADGASQQLPYRRGE